MIPSRPGRRALVVATVLALVAGPLLPAPAVLGDGGKGPATASPGSSFPGSADAPFGKGAAWSTPGRIECVQADPGDVRTTGPGATGREAGAVSASPSTTRLHLVTGETVVVREAGNEPSFEVVSGDPVRVVSLNDRTYLLPKGVDLSTYDRSLFEVSALVAAQADGGVVPVLLDTGASPTEVEAAGFENAKRLPSSGVVAAELDPSSVGEPLPGLVGDGLVDGVSLDRRVARPTAPVSGTRSLSRPGNLTGEGVTVAVLDTGIDATHPALEGRVVDRVDLVEGSGNETGNGSESARDENGHGTLVAGVLAGDGNHTGVAPGASIVDVRVMNDRGSGRASTIVEGIEYAVERDVDVILLSVSTSIDGSDEVARSVEWATERGVVVVAAAGNRGRPRTIGAPGRPGAAITVGATDGHGAVASYSSRGPTLDGHLKPDLVAPGHEVVGPRSSNSGRVGIDDADRYTWISGTSVAAPQVAGAVALLLEAEPGLTAREIEARLASAARPVGGEDAFAQGSGEVDVGRAVAPDVVVSDSVVDFGLLEADGTVNRTLTVANHDDRRHELAFDVAVRNVDLGVPANGTAGLSRTNLSLAPGERANLTLSVHGDTASGAHAGQVRYRVSGEPRSVAFGFVRGGTVTVEKRPLSSGARVDGDPLWVLTEEGTHDELLEFEDGTASFVAGGGTYFLWSWGTDEPTGTVVFSAERRGFDGPTHIVLDEADTVPVGVDAGPIVERYGPLANLSVTASVSTTYGDEVARLAVSDTGADSRAIRASVDPKLDVAATYLLAASPGGRDDLDAADVFQVGHGVDGVRGPSVKTVDPEDLETTEYRFHRTTVDETYRVQDRMVLAGVWNQISRRWFDLGGRTVQRVHRASGATYNRDMRGDGWDAYRDPPVGGDSTAQVLAHPMHGLFSTVRTSNGSLTVGATPFSDGSGTRFDPPGDHRLVVSVDGTAVREERVLGGSGSVEDVPVEDGQRLTVRVVGNNSGGRLSTRTVTETTIPAYDDVDDWFPVDVNRPPVVRNVSVPGASPANAVRPGVVTAVYEVDAVGPVVDPRVWYAVGDPAAPPWANRSGWERADVERFDGDVHATFDVGDGAGTVSLAAEFRDVRKHRTRTLTANAVHVGEAPNTSTAMLVGRFLAPNGSPADNDTVVVDPVGSGATRFVSTDPDGRIAVELPRGRSYDLTYLRGEPWTAREPTTDGRPVWLPLERVEVDEDVDLGTRSLPQASDLGVRVTDERGEPVAGATVRVTQRSGNVTIRDRLRTTSAGLATHGLRDGPGIRVAGPVELVVEPPDDDLYPEQTHRLNVTVDGPRVVAVSVETTPPAARLGAFGSFEPGDVVFLHAHGSDVPAGVAEYRWDLDGDGTADRVTGEPLLRYVPEPGSLRPTLTVVDRAGETDDSSVTLPIGGNETGDGREETVGGVNTTAVGGDGTSP